MADKEARPEQRSSSAPTPTDRMPPHRACNRKTKQIMTDPESKMIPRDFHEHTRSCGAMEGTCPVTGCSTMEAHFAGLKEAAATMPHESRSSLEPAAKRRMTTQISPSINQIEKFRDIRILRIYFHCSNCTIPLEECKECKNFKGHMAHFATCIGGSCVDMDCVRMKKLVAHYSGCVDESCPICPSVRYTCSEGRIAIGKNDHNSMQQLPSEDCKGEETGIVEWKIKAHSVTFTEHLSVEKMKQYVRKNAVKVCIHI